MSSRRTVSSPPEPRAESLETDLGTIIKLLGINILIQKISVYSISSMSCDPVTTNPQQIVLVNWMNERQLFLLYFSASSVCRNNDFFLNSFNVIWPIHF